MPFLPSVLLQVNAGIHLCPLRKRQVEARANQPRNGLQRIALRAAALEPVKEKGKASGAGQEGVPALSRPIIPRDWVNV